MSMPSQLMSRQQMSVGKSPVGKCQIGVSSNTLQGRSRTPGCVCGRVVSQLLSPFVFIVYYTIEMLTVDTRKDDETAETAPDDPRRLRSRPQTLKIIL